MALFLYVGLCPQSHFKGDRMPERPPPAKEEIESYLKDRRNWGRWGDDDDVGAMNLITPDKLLHAASVIKSGRSLSLSMFIPKEPGPGEPQPRPALDEGPQDRRTGWRSVHGLSME